jgi:glycosyltransferase involved in cell wall biosynthesis
VRSQLQLPAHAPVMLAFGHIRANKNLDLVLRAMTQVPEVFLIVAGQEFDSAGPLTAQYQTLATQLGVAERCRWQIGFVPEQTVANLFEASDLILTTYDRSFHSASGVLNTAAGYRKPCLASSGPGPLQSTVKAYGLGIWVEPDNLEA